MKLTLIIILTVIMSFTCLALQAKDIMPANTDSTMALGLHFGNVSGSGLAYRYFKGNWGGQAVLGGYSNGNNSYDFPTYSTEGKTIIKDRGKEYYVNLGLNGIYILKRTPLFNFYLTGGFRWSYDTKKNYYQRYIASPGDTTTNPLMIKNGNPFSSNKSFNLLGMGAGPGAELNLGKYFKLALEIPITYTGRHEFIMYVPQVGVYYYFK